MIKIVKFGVEYNIPRSAVATINAAYDGIRVILNDRTEISFQMNVSPQIKALIPVITISQADIISVDLDAAIAGNYDRVLTMTVKSDQQPQFIQGEHIIFDEKDPEEKKPANDKKPAKKPAAKRGRPPAKKK